MKTEIEVAVQTAAQCSFIPFTVVPDSWKGRKVKIVLDVDDTNSIPFSGLPWTMPPRG